MIRQIDIYSQVAQECGLKFFMSFDTLEAGYAGKEIFEYRKPTHTARSVKVYSLLPPKGLYSSK